MKFFITMPAEQVNSNNINSVRFIKKKLACELLILSFVFYLIVLCQI